jgi:hypothetical protein
MDFGFHEITFSKATVFLDVKRRRIGSDRIGDGTERNGTDPDDDGW